MFSRTILLILSFFISTVFAIKHPDGFTTLNDCIQNGSRVKFVLEEGELKQFVLELDNGVVVDAGGIVTYDGKILSDTETYKSDQQNLMKNSRDITKEEPIYFDGSLAVISSPGQQNYYHWMLQVLPRLKILAESKIHYDKIYLFADNFKYQWQKDSLNGVMNYLNIPQDKLLFTNKSNSVIEAKKLIVPSVAWLPSKNNFWHIWHYNLLIWYKKFFQDVFVKKMNTPKRIFISRSKAGYRRISNESDLFESLSKLGFISVRLEDMSIFEQATLFNNADIIVGPHGAGWTNLIFCKPNTKIIEIDHGVKGEQRSSFKGMAKFMNCIYYPFYVGLLEETDCPENVLDPINQDLEVDIDRFEMFLRKYEIN